MRTIKTPRILSTCQIIRHSFLKSHHLSCSPKRLDLHFLCINATHTRQMTQKARTDMLKSHKSSQKNSFTKIFVLEILINHFTDFPSFFSSNKLDHTITRHHDHRKCGDEVTTSMTTWYFVVCASRQQITADDSLAVFLPSFQMSHEGKKFDYVFCCIKNKNILSFQFFHDWSSDLAYQIFLLVQLDMECKRFTTVQPWSNTHYYGIFHSITRIVIVATKATSNWKTLWQIFY